MMIGIRNVRFSSVLLTLFFLLLIVTFALRESWLYFAYCTVSFAVIAIYHRKLFVVRGLYPLALIVFFVALTLVLPISMLRSETALLHYSLIFLSLSLAQIFTQDTYRYYQASRWSLFVVQGVIFFYLGLVGIDDFPLEKFIPDSSSNGITSYLIVLQVNYCVISYFMFGRVGLLSSVLTLLICIVGYGRGSILAAFLIFFWSLLYAYCSMRIRNKGLFLLPLVLVVCGGFFLLGGSERLLLFVEANTKIGSGFYDSERMAIIHEYFSLMNGYTFMFGANYPGGGVIEGYNNNPHNSFIRAHHIFGAPYLVAILFVLIASFSMVRSTRVIYFSCVMIFIMLFRGSTEPIIFPSLFDFYFFSLCIILSRWRSFYVIQSNSRIHI